MNDASALTIKNSGLPGRIFAPCISGHLYTMWASASLLWCFCPIEKVLGFLLNSFFFRAVLHGLRDHDARRGKCLDKVHQGGRDGPLLKQTTANDSTTRSALGADSKKRQVQTPMRLAVANLCTSGGYPRTKLRREERERRLGTWRPSHNEWQLDTLLLHGIAASCVVQRRSLRSVTSSKRNACFSQMQRKRCYQSLRAKSTSCTLGRPIGSWHKSLWPQSGRFPRRCTSSPM